MAPKKLKKEGNQPSMADYCQKGNAAAGSSCSTPRKTSKAPENEVNQAKVIKKEMDELGTSEGRDHLHTICFKFGTDKRTQIGCEKPSTVLQLIKSKLSQELDKSRKNKKKRSDENIIIKLDKGIDSSIVATHFPCTCVEEEQCLNIIISTKDVENKQEVSRVLPKENYSVFFIDKEGGEKTKTKTDKIFRCNDIRKEFRYYCVYGEKGKTVRDALKLDGRFVDGLGNFELHDNAGKTVKGTELVELVHKGKYKICLQTEGKAKATDPKQQAVQEQASTQQTSRQHQDANASASNNEQNTSETTTVLLYAAQNRVSLKEAIELKGNLTEIEKLLRQQFPELKEWMASRFPKHSFKEALKLKRENFGKTQQSFSEVRRIKKLLDMGKSVCKLIVSNWEGTGFVLFDRFILTSAHLFSDCVDGKNLRDDVDVFAQFNYEELKPGTGYIFSAEKTLVDIDTELDYAVLELKPEGISIDQEIPPGLLNKFGPPPGSGEACLIGHPAGGVKKIDLTFIIEPEKREQAVNDHLAPFNKTIFTIMSITQLIQNQGIEDIRVGGRQADTVETYSTFMYHGASGSPVFDANCRVFGLHTAGFTYGFETHTNSVIEFANQLLPIFKRFVENLKMADGMSEVLEKLVQEAKGNSELDEIIQSVGLIQNEEMDTS